MGEYIEYHGKIYPAHRWLEFLKLSAHAIVWPSGAINRLRLDNQGAFHAKGHNTNTLGIEFIVPGKYQNLDQLNQRMKTPYLTPEQYESGLWQVRTWMQEHNIEQINNNITTHTKLSPERRQDPGAGFPEQFFYDL